MSVVASAVEAARAGVTAADLMPTHSAHGALARVFRDARSGAATLWRSALHAPVVHDLVEASASRRFRAERTGGNTFFGAFASLEEAQAAIPKGVPASYDTPAAGTLYRERLEAIYPHDYPVLFWLKPLLADAERVFDLGGHVGIAHYAYERYLGSLSHLRWDVCDVPAVVEAGRSLAAKRGRRGLFFTSDTQAANGADVLLASGVLQYLAPSFLPTLLQRLPAAPRHIVISIVPTTTGRSFFTLNHIHTGICPYLIMNEQELVTGIVRAGYEHLDSWSAPGKTLRIPLHPEQTLDAYRGFYFRKAS
jgi:putative methyltransferase (TIGR04325 family)